jgi:hypothetical protein
MTTTSSFHNHKTQTTVIMVCYKAPLILMAIAYVAAAPSNDASLGQVERRNLTLFNPPDIGRIFTVCPKQCKPIQKLAECIPQCLNVLEIDNCVLCTGATANEVINCVECIAISILPNFGG